MDCRKDAWGPRRWCGLACVEELVEAFEQVVWIVRLWLVRSLLSEARVIASRRPLSAISFLSQAFAFSSALAASCWAGAQESEGEDAEHARVTLETDMGKGNVAARKSRVRVFEVGPRVANDGAAGRVPRRAPRGAIPHATRRSR